MKKNLLDQHMMNVIVSGKCLRWLEDMRKEYNKDHNSDLGIGTCAAILLETMCINYETKGLWKDDRNI